MGPVLVSTLQQLRPLDVLLSKGNTHVLSTGSLVDAEGMVSWAGFEQFVLEAVGISFAEIDKFDRGHVYVNEILQLGARLSITERSFVQLVDWDGDGLVHLDDWADFLLSRLITEIEHSAHTSHTDRSQWPDQLEGTSELALREIFRLRDLTASGVLPFPDVCGSVLPEICDHVAYMRMQAWCRVHPGQELKIKKWFLEDNSGRVAPGARAHRPVDFEEFRAYAIYAAAELFKQYDQDRSNGLNELEQRHLAQKFGLTGDELRERSRFYHGGELLLRNFMLFLFATDREAQLRTSKQTEFVRKMEGTDILPSFNVYESQIPAETNQSLEELQEHRRQLQLQLNQSWELKLQSGVMGVEELLRDEAAETIRAVCFGVEAKQRFEAVADAQVKRMLARQHAREQRKATESADFQRRLAEVTAKSPDDQVVMLEGMDITERRALEDGMSAEQRSKLNQASKRKAARDLKQSLEEAESKLPEDTTEDPRLGREEALGEQHEEDEEDDEDFPVVAELRENAALGSMAPPAASKPASAGHFTSNYQPEGHFSTKREVSPVKVRQNELQGLQEQLLETPKKDREPIKQQIVAKETEIETLESAKYHEHQDGRFRANPRAPLEEDDAMSFGSDDEETTPSKVEGWTEWTTEPPESESKPEAAEAELQAQMPEEAAAPPAASKPASAGHFTSNYQPEGHFSTKREVSPVKVRQNELQGLQEQLLETPKKDREPIKQQIIAKETEIEALDGKPAAAEAAPETKLARAPSPLKMRQNSLQGLHEQLLETPKKERGPIKAEIQAKEAEIEALAATQPSAPAEVAVEEEDLRLADLAAPEAVEDLRSGEASVQDAHDIVSRDVVEDFVMN
eukprot:TRINITY_DN3848_c0_g2_i3.p1 TRINITY_DN3848_c0_g2~~TRINITY_DN3848_c0_g2_i3.p1  ORF type:complete len:857 (+),score=272.81 TRINITY_DN3848_c0_g2_i3:265-2835(+)